MKPLLFLLLILSIPHTTLAQKYKFGKINKSELSEKSCPIEPEANACILYKERISYFEYRNDTGFIIKDDYYYRIKIYNPEGFDIATESIPFYYTPNHSEEIMGLKAVTYNLKNGKITKTKLNKKNVFIEKTSDHLKKYKFTMPDLQPGSIIEFKYSKYSPFLTEMDPVKLQYDYPLKNEEITINIPEYFNYRTYIKGYLPVNLNSGTRARNLTIKGKTRTGSVGFSPIETKYSQQDLVFTENTYNISMSNVPALKEEPYSGNINNYRSSVLFELIYIEYPESPRKSFARTWEDVANEAYLNSKFGSQLKKRSYLKDLMAKYTAQPNSIKKMIDIFELAKRKIKWNGKYDYYVEKSVVKAFNKGSGNVAEVNLNLINMLNIAGFEAYPVLASTIKHGIPLFATRTGFNYVIAAVNLNNKLYLLDATDTYATHNILPEHLLNFHGRLIKKDGSSMNINLFPEDYSNKITRINLKIDEDELSGMIITNMDKYFAYRLRKQLDSKNKESIDKWLNERNEELEITNSRINNLNKPYKQIMEAIQFNTDNYTEEISGQIFISPLLNKAFQTNPFKSEKRDFPVFFNFPQIKSITVNLIIPDNYEIVSLPQPAVYGFGDNDGAYEYKISQDGNKITVNSNYIINKAIIANSVYKDLKSFIDKVINKQNEKIVLKKK